MSIMAFSKALIIGASLPRRVGVLPEWREVSSNWALLVLRLIIGGLEGCA